MKRDNTVPASAHIDATVREIHGQVASCQETIQRAAERFEMFRTFLPFDQYTDIVITGCGSSFNLAKCGGFAWSEMLGRNVQAVPASELMHFPSRYLRPQSRPLVLAISRTGATTEVKLAIQTLRHYSDASTVALTLCPSSDIGAVCDIELAFPECYEESVVMTRAFTSILMAVYLLGDAATGGKYYDRLANAPAMIDAGIKANEHLIRALASPENASPVQRFFFLGSGAFKGLADESALKLTEMALLSSASYHSLEFRHGPIAALDEAGVVIIFPTQGELTYMPSLLRDITATGARGVIVVTSDRAENLGRISGPENIWATESRSTPMPEFLHPVIFAYAGQLTGYWRAKASGANPDHPRNLERTVFLNR